MSALMGLGTVLAVTLAWVSGVQGDVRWYALGDWGYPDSPAQHAVAAAMAEYTATHDPEFVLALGDNFYPYGISSTDDPRVNSLWRDMYSDPTLKDLHWWVALGNRDYGQNLSGEEWIQVALSTLEPRWHLPHLWHLLSRTDGEVTVDFVIIDTYAIIKRKNNYEAMVNWMEETLQTSVADWRIVVGHHPIYSLAKSGPIETILHDELLPALHRNRDKIDVYLSGHDHTSQVLQVLGDPDHYDFVVSGTGGAPLNPEQPTHRHMLSSDFNIGTAHFSSMPAFAAMTATSESLRIEFIDNGTNVIYSHERFKPVPLGGARQGYAGIVLWLCSFIHVLIRNVF